MIIITHHLHQPLRHHRRRGLFLVSRTFNKSFVDIVILYFLHFVLVLMLIVGVGNIGDYPKFPFAGAREEITEFTRGMRP